MNEAGRRNGRLRMLGCPSVLTYLVDETAFGGLDAAPPQPTRETTLRARTRVQRIRFIVDTPRYLNRNTERTTPGWSDSQTPSATVSW